MCVHKHSLILAALGKWSSVTHGLFLENTPQNRHGLPCGTLCFCSFKFYKLWLFYVNIGANVCSVESLLCYRLHKEDIQSMYYPATSNYSVLYNH